MGRGKDWKHFESDVMTAAQVTRRKTCLTAFRTVFIQPSVFL